MPRVCSYCVLDESVVALSFDKNGRCNSCREAERMLQKDYHPNEKGKVLLENLVSKLKREGASQEYDCIIGLSGGIDSAYLAHLVVKEFGLRPLAIHVDGGWNSEKAVRNINLIINKLDIDLFTKVIEWQEMRDLQLAFLKSGVMNQDIPQDHAFFSTLYLAASKFGVKSFLSGVNLATESVDLPNGSGHPSIDGKHVKDIHKKFGSKVLSTFPIMSILKYTYLSQVLKKPKIYKPLNWLSYDKNKAQQILEEEYGWIDYGTKHSESRFTKFYQELYLPRKINYDKRRLHLSSLIVAGQLSRSDAIDILKSPISSPREYQRDIKFVAKKLGITKEELEELIDAKIVSHQKYNHGLWILKFLIYIKTFLGKPFGSLFG